MELLDFLGLLTAPFPGKRARGGDRQSGPKLLLQQLHFTGNYLQ